MNMQYEEDDDDFEIFCRNHPHVLQEMADDDWTDIDGYLHLTISRYGIVCHNHTGTVDQSIDEFGYHCVQVYDDDGCFNSLRIHQTVARIFIKNPENKPIVQHIDQNKSNNHVSNLRWVTHSESQRRRRIGSNNTSGAVGVHFDKRYNKWCARINENGKKKQLGMFNTLEDAKKARLEGEKKYYGKYAIKQKL